MLQRLMEIILPSTLHHCFRTLLGDPPEGSCPVLAVQNQQGVCGVLSLECPLRYSTSSIPTPWAQVAHIIETKQKAELQKMEL